MAKKKKRNSTPQRVQPQKKKGMGPSAWIVGAVAIVAVVTVFALANGGAKGATGAPVGGATPGIAGGVANTASAIPADEAKYLGRLLPAAFVEPSVAGASAYSASVKMTDVVATQDAKQISVSVADVVAGKIVYFEYQKAGAEPLPMVAYVKPSGKLFVGVSYCPPCKGKRQSIEADGTLRCEACGTKRDLETGVGISGACKLYPTDEVPATVKGSKIVVLNSVLDGWTSQPLDRPTGA